MIHISYRILNVCKKYLAGATKAQDMAFYVSAIYLTRPDVKDSYLPGFIKWAHEVCVIFSLKFQIHFQTDSCHFHHRFLLKKVLSLKKEFSRRWPACSNMDKESK